MAKHGGKKKKKAAKKKAAKRRFVGGPDPGLDQSILASGRSAFSAKGGITRGRQNVKNPRKRR